MFYGATPQVFEFAKALRKNMTPAETRLWQELRRNKLGGLRFKAQHPIAHFVADFYCHKARLVIELDGSVHDSLDQIEYDANRTYMLQEFGLTVVRFRNEEVFGCIDEVTRLIATHSPATPCVTPIPADGPPESVRRWSG
ncbi:MAG: endonuclease domain-containing protein [Cytophagales bacterium]|nr:MAG: endonuclease domain-containing protein [Cytophagales bacterium]